MFLLCCFKIPPIPEASHVLVRIAGLNPSLGCEWPTAHHNKTAMYGVCAVG